MIGTCGLVRRSGTAALAIAVGVLGFGVNTAMAASPPKAAPTVVNVVLGDAHGLNSPMTLTVTPALVKAGKVKFVVKNAGTIIHEMIVLKTSKPFDMLAVVDAGDPPRHVSTGANKVDEKTKAGETGDIGKGKTKSVTLKLKAGSYVLVCNIAKHYTMGMRAAFKVTK